MQTCLGVLLHALLFGRKGLHGAMYFSFALISQGDQPLIGWRPMENCQRHWGALVRLFPIVLSYYVFEASIRSEFASMARFRPRPRDIVSLTPLI